MKKIVTYLFIVFLATLVFYGGAGVNLVTYCCGDCRMEGVTVLLENKCCEMHGQTWCSNQDGCCCDVEYVSFDWNVFHGHLFNLQPVAIDLVLAGVSLFVGLPLLVFATGLHWQCLFFVQK